MEFVKMQGLGNDFVFISDLGELPPEKISFLASWVCNRHFGIGADGLVLVLPSQIADVKMRIFNIDGSEAEMCGNAIRCLAKFARERGMIKGTRVKVETAAGLRFPEILPNGLVKVDMGVPVLERGQIPMIGTPGRVVGETLKVDHDTFQVTCVSMGNPHCVIQVPELKNISVAGLGPAIETHEVFPQKTNVEFVQLINKHEISMRVWERGAGETMACGTGACASVVAMSLLEMVDSPVTVHLPGGDLEIEWANDEHVYMTGPAVEVFTGNFNFG